MTKGKKEGTKRILPRIAGYPHLREPQDVDTVFSGLLDEGNGLVYAALQIEPYRLGLHSANADGFGH